MSDLTQHVEQLAKSVELQAEIKDSEGWTHTARTLEKSARLMTAMAKEIELSRACWVLPSHASKMSSAGIRIDTARRKLDALVKGTH